MQVTGFLSKVAERDKARDLDGLMLEDLNLYGCDLADSSISDIKNQYPSVDSHKKNPVALAGSTWIRSSWRSQTAFPPS